MVLVARDASERRLRRRGFRFVGIDFAPVEPFRLAEKPQVVFGNCPYQVPVEPCVWSFGCHAHCLVVFMVFGTLVYSTRVTLIVRSARFVTVVNILPHSNPKVVHALLR